MLDTLLALDASVARWTMTLRAPGLDPLMLAATAVDRWGMVWLAIGGAVAIVRPARLGGLWQLVLALMMTFVLVEVALKPAVDRDRPFIADPKISVVGHRETIPSFPSGHASTAFLGAFVVGRLWSRGRPFLWALAVLIATSRVYLGVHFPLDVMAGALLGTAIGWIATGGTVWDDSPHAEADITIR